MKKQKILIEEYDKIVSMDIESALTEWGYAVPNQKDKKTDIIRMVKQKKPDLVIMATGFRDNYENINTAKRISRQFNIGVILLIDWITEDIGESMNRLKQIYYMKKPFDSHELRNLIQKILIHRQN